MRNLASIQVVNAVEPIPNADAIEKIGVLGWWVVAEKGRHEVGSRVVFCEIDSLLPERPEFEFLRKNCFRPAQLDAAGEVVVPAGFRIKTIRMRGQVSQGICFPLSILPPDTPIEEGADVTEILGIRKWEPNQSHSAAIGGKPKGNFPGFLQKTDETRVQNLKSVLDRNRGRRFYLTEKLDGTSFTAFLKEDEFGICSRNLWLEGADESCVLGWVAKNYRLEEKMRSARERLGFDIALQGEVIGPGIQGNKYRCPAPTLKVFNVLELGGYRLFGRDEMVETLDLMGLDGVPQLGDITLDHSVDELVELAVDMSVLNPQVQREGLVVRPLTEEQDEDIGGRLSFKVINPKFLLKYDE